MIIIQNLPKTQSRRCDPSDITQRVVPAIRSMTELCRKPLGQHSLGALALAHCQVEQKDPLRFFVMEDGTCIVNPVITERIGDPVKKVEGCMSFAHRGTRKVLRYEQIRANFVSIDAEQPVATLMEDVLIEGEDAQVFQHEVDHMNGEHIF